MTLPVCRRPASGAGCAACCMREQGGDARTSTGGRLFTARRGVLRNSSCCRWRKAVVSCRALSDGWRAEVLPKLFPSGCSGRRDCRVVLLRTVVSFPRLGVCCPGIELRVVL